MFYDGFLTPGCRRAGANEENGYPPYSPLNLRGDEGGVRLKDSKDPPSQAGKQRNHFNDTGPVPTMLSLNFNNNVLI